MNVIDVEQSQKSISELINQIHITMVKFKVVSDLGDIKIPGPSLSFKKELAVFFSEQIFLDDNINWGDKIQTIELMSDIIKNITYDLLIDVTGQGNSFGFVAGTLTEYIKKMYFHMLNSEIEIQREIRSHLTINKSVK